MATVSAALAINAGSSSVKCALFTFERAPQLLARDAIDGAGAAALPQLLDWTERQTRNRSIAAIGHRVVHGGQRYRNPAPVDPALLTTLRDLIPFAPNHLPDEIALIEAIARRHPGVPQMVCFDTAFHADLPDVARRLPVPERYASRGVRRYGFHGLSFTYLVQELQALAGSGAAHARLVLAHLGNGSSLAAVRNGRSVDTTMGFTPIGGVVMGTRSGDLDPGVATYIARHDRLDADALEDLFSHRSGLAAVSGGTSDMRTLLEREPQDPRCRLAVAMYVYSIRKAIGALATALGGLDAIVFAGGIGEHAAVVRERIGDGLEFLGVHVDPARNAANEKLISATGARVAVWVLPTDEEIVIARAAHALFGSR